MPWNEVSTMLLRREFIALANAPDVNIRELCRRYSISPKTAYKWIARHQADGLEGLGDRSRCPNHSPHRTPAALEAQILRLRNRHPAWGGRKLRARLCALGFENVPAPSTITAILRRNGRLDPEAAKAHCPYQRFEHDAPNRLWQMDFKGHFGTAAGRCHPLTVLDDHSRFALAVVACPNERTATVQAQLSAVFRRYGLPERLLCDNGPPWGSAGSAQPYTPLSVWILRLGVEVRHGRPYHPQTQGKDERFHRTLNAEVLLGQSFDDLTVCQQRFDSWRTVYNHERPHEALNLTVPASRYQPSSRPFPERLPTWEYAPGDEVRKVQAGGVIHFRGREWPIAEAFRGESVALRPTTEDGCWAVYFGIHQITRLDLRIQS